jgi:hypothetical protein
MSLLRRQPRQPSRQSKRQRSSRSCSRQCRTRSGPAWSRVWRDRAATSPVWRTRYLTLLARDSNGRSVPATDPHHWSQGCPSESGSLPPLGRRQERVWRAQRLEAKIDAIAPSAGGRDRTPLVLNHEMPANCGLFVRGWKDSNLQPGRYELTSSAARRANFSGLRKDLTADFRLGFRPKKSVHAKHTRLPRPRCPRS